MINGNDGDAEPIQRYTIYINMAWWLQTLISPVPTVPPAHSLCREVAEEKGLLFTASLTATPIFENGGSRDDVIAAYKKQLVPMVEEGVDFIMCEVSTFGG